MSELAILCVDDEVAILKSLEIELQDAFKNNYVYEFAESAEEALEILNELYEDRISVLLVLSDWLMPGMKGDEFLIKVHQKYPGVAKVMLTGQANKEAVERARQQANLYRYLNKPWKTQELVETIRSAVNS